MTKSVPLEQLGDLCDVIGGGTPPKDKPAFYTGDILWATVRDMNVDVIDETAFKITKEAVNACATNIISPNNVVIASRVGLGKVCLTRYPTAINQDLRGIIPRDANALSVEYLFWWFKSVSHLIEKEGKGATVKGVTLPFIKSLKIPLPPLAEQKRIVAILDEAFEAIGTAKVNAERNLLNADELFDSYLGSYSSETAPLGELVNISTGKLDANAAVEGGKYPFFTCAKEVYAINDYAFDTEAILLAGNNAVGDFNVKHYSGKFNAYQRTYVITVKVGAPLTYRHLYYQLVKNLGAFKKSSVGAGTKFLKLPIIKELQIALPTVQEQERLTAVLDHLMNAASQLREVNTKRIALIGSLGNALLSRAFSGNL